MELLKGKYGYFGDGGRTYVITDWRTPRPWINVLANGTWGATVSQAGGGYSWLVHAMYNRVTRWNQDLTTDNCGKFLFVRDDAAGDTWSLTPQPMKPDYDSYRCTHGLGFTEFETARLGVEARYTVFVPPDLPCEVWRVALTNRSRRARRLTVFSYLELSLGVFPDWHREFDKTFCVTSFDARCNAVVARKTLWQAPVPGDEGWNKSWPYEAFFFAGEKPRSFECDRERFVGQYNTVADAAAFRGKRLSNSCGTGLEPIVAYEHGVSLAPGQTKELVFCLGAVPVGTLGKQLPAIHKAVTRRSATLLEETRAHWRGLCERVVVRTPEPAVDVLVNYWLPYQAIACRLLGRSAYYQCGGAFGFRDQLQDSQIWLSLDPPRTRAQLLEHARHQKSDGTVLHWWHAVTDEGQATKCSDDLLWLPYVTAQYLSETGDFGVLDEVVAWLDGGAAPLLDHCVAAIERVLQRRSPRGLCLMGDCDWNDGLNGVGPAWKGESTWVSEFLYGLLQDFSHQCERAGRLPDVLSRWGREREALGRALREHMWNGRWFDRATTDDGRVLGNPSCKRGKMFLNAQTWAVLSGLVEGAEARKLLGQVERFLYRDYGVLLFTPAYDVPDRGIGYLTRYAPGVRENGGCYTHAAVWAVLAQARARPQGGDQVWETFRRLLPPLLSQAAPDRYRGEPYVTPGNIEGPESPHEGQGAWTWYTGSSAWLYRAALEHLLGVRVVDGELLVEPHLPAAWDGFTLERNHAGRRVQVTVARGAAQGALQSSVLDVGPARGK